MNRALAASIALIAILLVAVVFAPVPGDVRWLKTLHEAAHGPVFGLIAVLTCVAIRTRRPLLGPIGAYVAAFIGAVALGVLTELAQILFNGDASWTDVAHDAMGAAAFLSIAAAFDPRLTRVRASLRATAAVVGAVLLAWLATPVVISVIKYHERRISFPVLADFSRRLDQYFIGPDGALMTYETLPESLRHAPGEAAARVQFVSNRHPRLMFFEPAPDWRGRRALAFDVANPTRTILRFVVRVHDKSHNNESTDRFNRQFSLAPHTRAVFCIPLADIERAPHGRRMDMRRIAAVVIFRKASRAPEMYLSKMWLE